MMNKVFCNPFIGFSMVSYDSPLERKEAGETIVSFDRLHPPRMHPCKLLFLALDDYFTPVNLVQQGGQTSGFETMLFKFGRDGETQPPHGRFADAIQSKGALVRRQALLLLLVKPRLAQRLLCYSNYGMNDDEDRITTERAIDLVLTR